MYQTALDNCVEKKAFIAYLQKNHEYDYYLLYSLICSFEETKEGSVSFLFLSPLISFLFISFTTFLISYFYLENQRFKIMEEIFIDFLGFEGGDKRVAISASVVKVIIFCHNFSIQTNFHSLFFFDFKFF